MLGGGGYTHEEEEDTHIDNREQQLSPFGQQNQYIYMYTYTYIYTYI
jgi:hypothetical protein